MQIHHKLNNLFTNCDQFKATVFSGSPEATDSDWAVTGLDEYVTVSKHGQFKGNDDSKNHLH